MSEPLPDDLRRTLRVIAEEADGLRRGGVRRITVAGVSIALAPWEAPVTSHSADRGPRKRPGGPSDPLDDPDTYPHGRVPSYNLEDFENHGDEDEHR